MADVIFTSGDVQAGYGYVGVITHRLLPSAAEIDQMDQVLGWVYAAFPEGHETARRLIWLRAEGRGWRSMASCAGLDPMTCKRHYLRAIGALVGHLMERGLLV
jgi:hypothetical protein